MGAGNGHGGNYLLGNAVRAATARGELIALFPALEGWEPARLRAGVEASLLTDMHAGEMETSIFPHDCPAYVRSGYRNADFVADDRRRLLSVGMAAYTDSGVRAGPR